MQNPHWVLYLENQKIFISFVNFFLFSESHQKTGHFRRSLTSPTNVSRSNWMKKCYLLFP